MNHYSTTNHKNIAHSLEQDQWKTSDVLPQRF